MKKFLLFLPLLAAFPSFVSACAVGESHEPLAASGGIINFGFVGGVVSALIVVAIVLSIMVLNNKVKGGIKK